MQEQYLGVGETFNFQEIEVKGEKEYTITGYISTKSVDKFNDSITDECLDDMLTQIKSGSIKMDYEHETIHENDLNKNPIARIIDAKKDDKGLWVKATLNKSNPRFNEIWGSIKDGFLDAFSIAFKPLETATRYIQGKAVRILNKLKLINVGITGTPVNEECRMDKVVIKAIKDLEDDSDDDEGWEKFDDLDDTELKHKYIKRTGSPGNYTYFYSNKEYEDYKKSKNSNSLFAEEDYKQKVLDSFSKDELKDFKEVLSDENKKDIVQSWFGRNNLGKDYKLNDKFDEMLNEEKGEKHLKEKLMNIPMNKLQEMKKDIKEKPNKMELLERLTRNNTATTEENLMPEIYETRKGKFQVDEDELKKYPKEKQDKAKKLAEELTNANITESDFTKYSEIREKEKPNKKKLIQALTDNNTIKNSESMMPEINQSGTSKKIIFSIDKEDKKKFSSEKLEKAQKLVDALNEADISEEDISQYDDDNIKEEKQKESNEDKLKKEGFIIDEDEARRKAFQEAKEKGKLFNLNTWKKKREEERVRILEKKALNTQSGLLGKPEDHTSHSTSKEEDNKQMAEEIENKPVEETEVKEEQVAEQSENKEVQETTESNNEQNNTAEVEALKSELAEVKAQLVEVQKQLAKPELKALQEAKPITKLGETVTPLGLIG